MAHPGTMRTATPRDLETLVAHRRGMWEDMGRLARGAPDASEPMYRRWLLQHLLTGDFVAFVVEDAAVAVASGCVWNQECHPRPHLPQTTMPYFLSLYVAPSHRGQGIARAITEAVIRQARSWGSGRLVLHASDAGRPLYEAMGFRTTPEMWLDLPPA